MKRCTDCKSTELHEAEVPVTLTLPFRTVEGEIGERTFEGTVTGVRCESCGSYVYDGPDLGRFERLVALRLLTLGISTGAEARFLRKKAGLKAVDLAALLGVTPETVSHWENGKSQPSPSELAMILQLTREELERDVRSRKLLQPAPTTRELLERIRSPQGDARVLVGKASVLAA
jgi:transcriptional regulator with XRE-family HTH domain